jgi:hypothetical protein
MERAPRRLQANSVNSELRRGVVCEDCNPSGRPVSAHGMGDRRPKVVDVGTVLLDSRLFEAGEA